ncbi:RNA-directed DNA polymerase, eukaryota, reverse transcriptase zinc-binding domain protein [Tanacetum coccineum]|uniref:RNA-directed DNA polymerase, eukaryota, reverse transcriptase zinc-binding domain protein n=1 Tax=Tanacetum coccineum TaxID=301880 RepID=A0ABQ4WVE5_9ASTR
MSNMYVICRNKGLTKLKIHHVGGLWIWIQFPSSSSAYNFQTNISLKSIYSCIKTDTPSFRGDERMILIEIHGLPLCAWGSNAYKKAADMFGKFMFFEAEESKEMSSGTWNINIVDETFDSSDNIDVNGIEKVEDFVDESSLTDLNDLKETLNELESNEIQHPISKENMDPKDDINNASPETGVSLDLSRPPGRRFLSMARGKSGGLISMWDPNSFIKDDIWCDDAFIIVKEHWKNTSVEEKIEASFVDDDDRESRIKLLQEVDRLDTFESFDLFQKARVKWDIEGDDNSKNFHRMIKQKRRAQMIHDHDSNVDFPPFANSSGLCALNRDSFETPISFDEVKNAVWDYGSSKVPGPDGFSFAFVKKYWDGIKVEILEYVNIFLNTVWRAGHESARGQRATCEIHFTDFALSPFLLPDTCGNFSKGSWIKACLSSSRSLVLVNGSPNLEFSIKRGLRKGDPLSPFIFILVIEGLHNALSTAVSSGLIKGVKFCSPKVTISHLFYVDDVIITTEWNAIDLDNIIRVLQVIDKIVSPEQSAFIVGHQILDDPLILSFVLLNLGFGSKWRSWIRACLSSSQELVLVNGSPTLKFCIKRGMRKGDPLSPFLFIIVIEGLHNALSTAVSLGLIRGVKFGSHEVTISHILYADDVIITTVYNANDLENIIRVL